MITRITQENKELIDQLFFNSWKRHTHPGWTTLDQIIASHGLCFVKKTHEGQAALLSLVPVLENTYWVNDYFETEECPQGTLDSLIEAACDGKNKRLYAISAANWFSHTLSAAHFTLIDHFIQLSCTHPTVFSPLEPTTEIQFRPMTIPDIPKLIASCENTFAPIWRISMNDFLSAYQMSDKAVIAENKDRLAAYLLTSRQNQSVHLMRMAVASPFQTLGIGSLLLQHFFRMYDGQSITEYTVNTTQRNASALHLYKKYAFNLYTDSFPVYTLQH